MTDKFEFHQHQGQQIAKNEGSISQEIHNHGNVAEWKEPFIEMKDQLAEKQWQEDTPTEIVEKFATPADAVQAIEDDIEADLKLSAPLPPEEIEAKTKSWNDTLGALVPMGIKLATNVGNALVTHAASKTAGGVAAKAFFSTIGEMTA